MDKPLILWFGDSWSIGDGLGASNGLSQWMTNSHWNRNCSPELAFPSIVSSRLEDNYRILGNRGETIQQMGCRLKWYLDEFPVEEETVAYFCFPNYKGRYYYIDNDGKEVRGNPGNAPKHVIEWQDVACKWDATIAINWIYNTCLANKITPRFLQTWRKIELVESIDQTSGESWVISPSECLSDLAFGKGEFGNQYVRCRYRNTHDNHPNQEGQRRLADALLETIAINNV